MQYPRRQGQVVELADQMIIGITENPEKFPSCDAAGLQVLRNEFAQISDAFNNAEGQAAVIAAQKLEIFKRLRQEIKRQVKYGTADTSNKPEEVVLMGWGQRREPQQIEIPATPVNLRITAQGDNGMLCLIWEKSKNGGPVRSYTIERKFFARPHTEDRGLPAEATSKAGLIIEHPTSNTEHRTVNKNDWSEWQFAGSSYNTDIKLTKQPIGIKLWYQVRAGNSSGQSCPSNTVAIVL